MFVTSFLETNATVLFSSVSRSFGVLVDHEYNYKQLLFVQNIVEWNVLHIYINSLSLVVIKFYGNPHSYRFENVYRTCEIKKKISLE